MPMLKTQNTEGQQKVLFLHTLLFRLMSIWSADFLLPKFMEMQLMRSHTQLTKAGIFSSEKKGSVFY